MTRADVPWFAGVLDACAHFRLENRRGTPQPRLRVTTSRLGLLQVMCEMTGTRLRQDDRGYTRRLCADHCTRKHVHVARNSSYWNADCTRATIILHNCLPFLRSSRDEARTLLDVGGSTYQPRRNGTATSMLRLGWSLPIGVEEAS